MKLRKGGKFNKKISENYKPYQENKESFSNIETSPECEEYKLSEKMEENLKLLVEVDELVLKDREERDRRRRRRVKVTLGFVASFIVVVIIGLSSIQNQSYAGLMDIIKYWIKPSEKETEIITKKETHNVIVDDFVEPTYIPDEYNDVERDEGRSYIRITYKNNIENKTIRYRCSFVADTGVTGLDTEDAEVEHINLEGNDVMLIYKDDMINVFFIDDIYEINILFELSEGMDFKVGKDEVIKIIKSIK